MSPGAATRRGEAAVSSRACWVYWSVVALLFGAGCFQRFSLPATPFSDPDTWGYLFPGLSAFTRGAFVHTYGRTFVYPLFVYGILRGFHDFAYVSLIQHLLGLFSGVLLLAAWRELARVLPDRPAIREWHRWLGLVALAVFLLSKTSLLMEHSIRPEAVFPFIAIRCIWLALRYWREFEAKKLRAAFWWGGALFYDSVLLYFLKPAWGFGVVFAMAPLLLSLCLLRGYFGYRVLIVLLPALLVFGTLFAPERSLVREYDPGTDCFLPSLLLSVHADIILDEMTRDLADGAVPERERGLVSKLTVLIRAEVERTAPRNSQLAFNPDVFLYGKDNVCGLAREFFAKDTAAYNDFCFAYYEKAWLHQPGRMLGKVARQLGAFYSWENQGYDVSLRAYIGTGYTALRTRNALQDLGKPLPFYEEYRRATEGLEHSEKVWRQSLAVTLLNMLLYACYPNVVFGSVAAACVILFRRNAGHWKELAPLALWSLYLHSYNFGNCLTIAVVHNMQIGRYVKNQLIYTVFSECCGVLLILAAIQAYRMRDARPSSMPQRGFSVAGR